MPVICWKTKKPQTTISARFTPGVQALAPLPVLGLLLLVHPPGARLDGLAPRRPRRSEARASRALSKWPWRISQRGDSGIVVRRTRPSRAGTAPSPRMRRQPTVAGAARGHPQDHQRDDVGDEDPDGDHPLLQHRQRPPPALRGVLGDVGGGDRRVGADGQADERAGRQQDGGVRRDGREDRPERVDGRIGDQQRLAAEAVGEGPADERADGRAERGAGDQVALPEPGQVVRHEVERRADVRGVVAEEEAAQRGEERQLPVEGVRYPVVEVGEDIGLLRGRVSVAWLVGRSSRAVAGPPPTPRSPGSIAVRARTDGPRSDDPGTLGS